MNFMIPIRREIQKERMEGMFIKELRMNERRTDKSGAALEKRKT